MEPQLDMYNLARNMTLHIKARRVREWMLRTWLATLILRLAAWIMWADVAIEIRPREENEKILSSVGAVMRVPKEIE